MSSKSLPNSLPELHKVHLIGAGGVGVAALGEILLDTGCTVSGSDLVVNAATRRLTARGAVIFTGHDAQNLPEDADCVIYSSAAAEENPELCRARELGLLCLRRGDFLGLWARRYRVVAAVSGSHGKTSVTSLLTFLIRKCGGNPGWLIGGSVPGMHSGSAGGGEIFITEVDESDGSHTVIFPSLGIIINADDDHAWSVGGVEHLHENFHCFAKNSKTLLGDPSRIPQHIWEDHPDFHSIQIVPGGFQEENRQLAVAAARLLGFAATEEMTDDFPGVERRMTVRRNDATALVIEDYAHAPAELRSSLASLRKAYPDRHLRVLFQPHRYARLARYFKDFEPLLKSVDSCFIAPVFAAWCENGVVGSAELAAAVGGRNCPQLNRELAETLLVPPPDGKPLIIAVIGAGDVNAILPFLQK